MTPERVAELQCSVGIAAGTFAERLADTSAHAQGLYRAVLPALARTGMAPPLPVAAQQARLTPEQAEGALRELAAADLVAVDAGSMLVGAFPLSATPTRHQVRVDGRPVLHAMCAVDALGVPAMLGEPGVVVSIDPATDQAVTVHIAGDATLTVEPPDAVVLLAAAGGGSLASSCCSVIDFYASAQHARQRLSRPGTMGDVITVADAHALGVALFAGLPGR